VRLRARPSALQLEGIAKNGQTCQLRKARFDFAIRQVWRKLLQPREPSLECRQNRRNWWIRAAAGGGSLRSSRACGNNGGIAADHSRAPRLKRDRVLLRCTPVLRMHSPGRPAYPSCSDRSRGNAAPAPTCLALGACRRSRTRPPKQTAENCTHEPTVPHFQSRFANQTCQHSSFMGKPRLKRGGVMPQ
jgi:hypothetical protein